MSMGPGFRVVAVQVSKHTLNVCFWGKRMAYVRNSAPGIDHLLHAIQTQAPDLVAIEASGGLEQRVAEALSGKGIAVAVVNSSAVKDFAEATGRLANTGGVIDARSVCAYALKHRALHRGSEVAIPS